MSAPGGGWMRSAVANVSVMLPYHAVDSLLVFLYTMLIARSLGAHDFGLFATGVAIGALLFLFMDFGSSLRIVRDVAAASPVASALKTCLVLRLAATLLLILASALAWTGGRAGGAQLAGLVCLLAAGEGLRSALALAQGVLLGQGRPGAFAAVGALEKAGILLILLVWTGSRGELTPWTAALALLAGRLGSSALAGALTHRAWSRGALRLRNAIQYVRGSRDVGLFVLSERSLAYGLPLLITLSVGVSATGQFQAAYKILMVPVSFFTVFASALYPVVTGLDRSSPDEARRAISLGLFTLLMAASWSGLLLLSSGKSLILLVFGEAFQPAGQVLRGLAPVAVLAAVWQFSLHILTALHRERLVLRASLASGASVLILTVVLGIRFGLGALPLALMVGLSMSTIISFATLHREGLLSLRTLRPLGLASAVGLSLVGLLLLRGWFPARALLHVIATATVVSVLLPATLLLTGTLPFRWLLWSNRPRPNAWVE